MPSESTSPSHRPNATTAVVTASFILDHLAQCQLDLVVFEAVARVATAAEPVVIGLLVILDLVELFTVALVVDGGAGVFVEVVLRLLLGAEQLCRHFERAVDD